MRVAWIQRFYRWMFSVPAEPRSLLGVIGWWELRRIPYNIIVGSVGLCSLILFFVFITHCDVLEPGEDAEEPIAIILAPFLINICYTGGWFVEIVSRSILRERGRASWTASPEARPGLFATRGAVTVNVLGTVLATAVHAHHPPHTKGLTRRCSERLPAERPYFL